jgi:hypothetical protein
MYTFNLSTIDKQSKLKQKLKEKDGRKGANFKVDGAPVKSNEEDSKKASPTLKN